MYNYTENENWLVLYEVSIDVLMHWSMVFNLLSRQHGGMRQLQAIGHQVVGSGNASHEDVQMMYNKFFGGETASIKTLLKAKLGSIGARRILSQIFQVYYFMCTYTHTIYVVRTCNFMTGNWISCGYMYYIGNIWQCTKNAGGTPRI